MQNTTIKSIFILSLFLACNASHAQMIQNLLIGNAKAVSLGNAVTADPPGIDSINFNPAGLTRLKGRQYEIKFVAADFSLTGEFQLNSQETKDRYEELGQVDPLANTTSDMGDFAVYLPFVGHTAIPVAAFPLGGVSYNRKGSKFTFANNVYAPMAFGMTRKDDDPGTVYGKELSISRITFFAPSFGYQLTDRISIGLSVGFSYTGLGLDLPFRAPNILIQELGIATDQICGRAGEVRYTLNIPGLNVCAGKLNSFDTLLDLTAEIDKPVALTYNLGFLWDITDWLTVGALYQSGGNDALKGDIALALTPPVNALLTGIAESQILGSDTLLNTIVRETLDIPEDGVIKSTGHINFPSPKHIALGVSLQALPRLKVNIDVKWTETSSWKSLEFVVDDVPGVLILLDILGLENVTPTGFDFPRDYIDTVNWGFGFEYKYSQKLDLRLGYEPRKTGIPDNRRDFLIPFGDMNIVSVGFSYTISKTRSFDFAIFQLKYEAFLETGSTNTGNDTRNQNIIYNPTAGLDTQMEISATIIEMSYRKRY